MEINTVSTVALDLARWQFASTTLFHYIFVPLTLGLTPLVAIMQTKWHRTGDERWLRLTKFFGTLLLINFAIGVATGLVQEFQFGMNWSGFSRYVGDIFGAPLAVEALGAFFLESTFLGLWIFGWDRLSPRVHLATIYAVWAGTWLSAFFILSANSWMQHPVGYEMGSDGHVVATDIFAILFQKFVWFAVVHTLLAAFMTAAFFMLGVSCWQIWKGKNPEVFRMAAKLAIIIAVPASAINLAWGSEFGVEATNVQPMKIAASEALWDTEQPAAFSLVQIGGFTQSDQDPSFDIEIPRVLSFLATNSFSGEVKGINQLQAEEEEKFGPGNYIPDVKMTFWSMRTMAYLGSLSFLIALIGAWLMWKDRFMEARWFHRLAIAGIFLPFLSNFAGWLLTEAGRQPWVVYGLLKTEDAVSPSVSTGMVGASLGAFVLLYGGLACVEFWLMRRYATGDLPEVESDSDLDGKPKMTAGY